MKKIICLIAMALFTVTGCTSVEMNQTKTDTPDDNTQGNATTLSCADYTLNPLWNWAETPANSQPGGSGGFYISQRQIARRYRLRKEHAPFGCRTGHKRNRKRQKELCKGGCSIYLFRNLSAERHHRSPEMACSAVGSVCSERSENIARSGD